MPGTSQLKTRNYRWIIPCLLIAAMASGAEEQAAGPAFRKMQLDDIYRAIPLKTGVELVDLGDKLQRRWDFADNTRAGFTSFSRSAGEIKVADGRLSFTTGAEPVKLGWGNWDGKQPAAETIDFGDARRVAVDLRVKQTAKESQWKLDWRADGQGGGRRGPKSTAVVELTGSEWQNASFAVDLPGGNGFELTITGPAGNRIEIDELRIKQRLTRGYFRKEFTIPDGAKVWRAILAAPPATADIYVNGQPVPWSVTERYAPEGLAFSREITAQLKSGANCIAYEIRADCPYESPQAYCHGRVILTTGEEILLGTDKSWRCLTTAPGQGWTMPGFDDKSWTNALESWVKSGNRGLVKQYQGSLGSMILRPEWPLPAYDGRLLYEHPEKRRLYYRDDQPAILNVRAPAGLADRQPELSWALRVVGGPYNMAETVVKQGTAAKFNRQGDSIVFPLDFGRLEQGVYTLETELKAGGETLEFHYREPLLVTGRIPMPEVAGLSYEDGLDLEQEDVIDFTRPDDPHRWIEVQQSKTTEDQKGSLLTTPPRIIRRQNLVYRELQERFSVLAAELAFRHPGDWYLMVLEYPDDAWRGIAVTISNADTAPKDKAYMIAPAFAIGSAAVVTGGKFPVSQQMKELKFLVRADTGKTCAEIWNWLSGGGRAAVARLSVHHIKNPVLPALKVERSGERFIGPSPESLRWGRMLFGNNSPGLLYLRWDVDVPGSRIYRLACNYDSARHLTQYLRFCGLNFHTLGAYQYSEVNNSYSLPQRVACSQLPCDINDVALRVFEANGISALNWIEFWENRSMSAQYLKSAAQVAAGADTIKQVMANGQQTGIANFLHPKVEELFLGIVDDLALQFSDSPAWKGVGTLPCPHPVGLGPAFMSPLNDPLGVCYSDATIGLFEKETGIKVPATGPARFAARQSFLTSPDMREKWIAWRCGKQRDIVVKTRDVLQRHRKDAWSVQVNYMWTSRISQWLSGEGSYHAINRLYGFDSSLYKNLENIWYGRCVYTDADCSQAQDAHRASREAANDYDAPRNRMAFIRTAWIEDLLVTPKDARWPYASLEVTKYPRYAGDYCKEDFAQTMIGTDPELVLFGWADAGGEQTGQEQRIREVARVVTALPADKLPLVLGTDFDANLAIRAGRSKGRYWFYAANPGFWSIKGHMVVAGAKTVYDASSGEKVQVSLEDGKALVPVELGSYGMQAFVADPAEAEVVGFKTAELAGNDRDFLRQAVAEARSVIENPGMVACFAPAEIACIAKTSDAAQQDLTGDQYAAAWSVLQAFDFQHIISSRDYRAALVEKAVSDLHPSLKAVRSEKRLSKDEVFDPAFWTGIPGSRDFKPVSRQLVRLPGRPAAECEIKAVYDENCLYLAFSCADRDVKALQSEAKTPPELFKLYDDCIDFFIAPAEGAAPRVYQFALNPAGAPRLTQCHGAGAGAPPAEWESKVVIGRDRWTAICAFPFSALDAQPAAGQSWRVNFRRRYRQFALPESVWSVVISYTRDVANFGTLQFM